MKVLSLKFKCLTGDKKACIAPPHQVVASCHCVKHPELSDRTTGDNTFEECRLHFQLLGVCQRHDDVMKASIRVVRGHHFIDKVLQSRGVDAIRLLGAHGKHPRPVDGKSPYSGTGLVENRSCSSNENRNRAIRDKEAAISGTGQKSLSKCIIGVCRRRRIVMKRPKLVFFQATTRCSNRSHAVFITPDRGKPPGMQS